MSYQRICVLGRMRREHVLWDYISYRRTFVEKHLTGEHVYHDDMLIVNKL